MLGFSGYNYEHFSREIFQDLAQTSLSGPRPGEQPRFQGDNPGWRGHSPERFRQEEERSADLRLRHLSHDRGFHWRHQRAL